MHARIARGAGATPVWTDASLGWLLGAIGVVIFALTIPMTRLASGSADAPQLGAGFVAVGRAALAGVLAAGYLLLVRAPLPHGSQWRQLALTALGVVFGFPLLMGFAVLHVDAVHASVVTGVLPLATAALAAWLLGQRPPATFWLCALLGATLVIGFAWWKGGAGFQLADALLLGAVLTGAFGYVSGARLAGAMAPQQVISWLLVLSLPITLPIAVALWPAAPVRPAAWAAFGYVSVFSMWLGFFAWYAGLALGGTVRVSQVQLVQPFASMWFAVPLLGESLDAVTVLFSLAVMATVFMSRRAGSAAQRRGD